MSGPVQPVAAVIFDWGGTLTPWHTIDLAEQWHVFARAHAASAGMTDEEAARLADRINSAEEAAWRLARQDGGSARIAEIRPRKREVPPGEVGLQDPRPCYAAALHAYEEFWEPHTLLDEDVPALWRGLRERGIKIGVLSNTVWTREYHERVFARDGVLHLIDGAVYSSEIRHAKPHPRAFEAALDAVGVAEPSHAVYVGDRPFEDVHGAQRVGMRAVWVPHSEIPPQQMTGVRAEDVQPDAVVERLSALLDVVDQWNGAGL